MALYGFYLSAVDGSSLSFCLRTLGESDLRRTNGWCAGCVRLTTFGRACLSDGAAAVIKNMKATCRKGYTSMAVGGRVASNFVRAGLVSAQTMGFTFAAWPLGVVLPVPDSMLGRSLESRTQTTVPKTWAATRAKRME